MVKILYSNDYTIHVALNALHAELVLDLKPFKFNSTQRFVCLQQLDQAFKAFLSQCIVIKFDQMDSVAGLQFFKYRKSS